MQCCCEKNFDKTHRGSLYEYGLLELNMMLFSLKLAKFLTGGHCQSLKMYLVKWLYKWSFGIKGQNFLSKPVFESTCIFALST